MRTDATSIKTEIGKNFSPKKLHHMQKDKDNAGKSHPSTRDFKLYPSMAEKSGPVAFPPL